MMYGRL